MEITEVAKVNYFAVDTWLEPYIGWKFEITRKNKSTVYFKMDMGEGTFKEENHDAKYFDIVLDFPNRKSTKH